MALQPVDDVRLLQLVLSTWLRTRYLSASGRMTDLEYVALERQHGLCHGLPERMFSWHNADEVFCTDKGRDTDGL
jgi:hypothetical protein